MDIPYAQYMPVIAGIARVAIRPPEIDNEQDNRLQGTHFADTL